MKKRYLFFGALLLNAFGIQAQYHLEGCPVAGSGTVIGSCSEGPYVLVFEDNFFVQNGFYNGLDTRNWGTRYPQGAPYLDVNESCQEWNTLDNVSATSDGVVITAKYEPGTRIQAQGTPASGTGTDGGPNLRPYDYTSSSLWSNYVFDKGYFEMRCRMQIGSGYWPAFWLYNKIGLAQPELDIFEMWDNNSSDINMTIHQDGMCGNEVNYESSSDWVTYSVYWDDWRIVWLLDGHAVQVAYRWKVDPFFPYIIGPGLTCEAAEQYGGQIPTIINDAFPTYPMQIVFNLAVRKGTPSPNPVNFPGKMEVDYIRYYQQRSECGDEKTYTTRASLGLGDGFLTKPYYHHITNRVINIYNDITLLMPDQLKLTASQQVNVNIDPVTGQPNPAMNWYVAPGANVEIVIDPNICTNNPVHSPIANVMQNETELLDKGKLEETALGLPGEVVFKPQKVFINPNPANGEVVTVQSTERTKVIITNTQGIKVKEVEVQAGSNELNVQDLDSGVYQLYFEALKETIKLVKL